MKRQALVPAVDPLVIYDMDLRRAQDRETRVFLGTTLPLIPEVCRPTGVVMRLAPGRSYSMGAAPDEQFTFGTCRPIGNRKQRRREQSRK